MVLMMTLNERLPFFALALVALALPSLGKNLALVLTFVFVIWQSFGGGLTGTAWQSMISKIIPAKLRGRYFGAAFSASNLMSGGGALVSGLILERVAAPGNFALCFFLTGLAMMVSFAFLTRTREPDAAPARETSHTPREFWRAMGEILRRDATFRLFIVARILSQVAAVGLAFFTIYAVRRFAMDAGTAGVMTGVLLIAQLFANPVFGWLGDRYSHRLMFAVGVLLATASAVVALFAPSLGWFYVVFALAGIANAGFNPTIYALTVEFGSSAERPYYIGLANSLVAPATLLAPILGGALADSFGFAATFGLAAACGVVTALRVFWMPEPRQRETPTLIPAAPYVEQP